MLNTLWRRIVLTDWEQRLCAILTGIYLYQFVIWITKEDGMWLPETVAYVTGTLGIVAATYMLPHIRSVWRSFIQFILIVGIHAVGMGYHFVTLHVTSWKTALRWIALNAGQLEPYIWFSLTAWVIYLFAMWSVKSRLRIFVLITVSILFFSIRDSFSAIFLWPQVAMVIFCGFSLLIVRHFAKLKKRAPVIWETITDYPSSLLLPVALIVSVIGIVGFLAPTVDPVLTDPYTAWKVSRGEPVPLLGKGVSVTASAADSSSGYSRDDSTLGGGFQFDYTPVMTVETSKRTYFRGETRAQYNGKGWEPSANERRMPLNRVNLNVLPLDPRFDTSQLETKEVTQTIVMERDETFPVLFGGYAIQRLVEVNQGENQFQRILWSPRQSELRYSGRTNYPKEYAIVTQEPILGVAKLREVNVDYANKPEWAEYLQVPADLPARVKQLAADITKSATNAYDKAKLIETYLSETYPYTNTPDESKGKSKDFVDRFLFEVKQGYCDYYSTSMAVLSRSIGLPTRWVKGYSSGASPVSEEVRDFGILSQLGADIDEDAAGTYTVRNSDAHSWVEVYFEGFGWIPFEPTSGFSLPNVFPEVTPPPSELSTESDPVTLPEEAEAAPSFTWLWITFSAAAGAAAIAAGAWLFFKGAYWQAFRARRKLKAVNFNQKIIVEFERLLRMSRRKGYTRLEHETMREATARWANQSKWMKHELETVLELFERAKYSQAASTEADYQAVSQSIIKLKEQMK
ncbi:DUF3488 and DUF4129 domain-containing transglutaminase family protein [Paenibacillus sp. GCM10023248]|uniref:transglutaminase TgpA family protein n=1 Tax=unclassified Paenibacillus TaxID=185978 RepID=UPI002379CB5C|nr:transglutaminase domain-containing protein [Paenibacillus sp. MAHUQ-63]MDD9268739.1 transglutaminase domain-containing protein [Paenibacillus sp. MAHUQ-63]